jgi:hypothetical protein
MRKNWSLCEIKRIIFLLPNLRWSKLQILVYIKIAIHFYFIKFYFIGIKKKLTSCSYVFYFTGIEN